MDLSTSEKSKIIFLDYSIYLHRAAYISLVNPMPISYTILNMIVASLKRIGVEPYDKVIVACDGRNSWRKDLEKDYKGDRAEKKAKSGINWDNAYKEGDKVLYWLDKGTDFHVIKLDRIEADDVMAVGCRYFKDHEIILSTYDQDLEQCWYYSNVKIWSIMKKMKGGKGAYKIPPKRFNAQLLIAKKVEKEVSDNLTNPVLTREQAINRRTIIDLLNLPDFVEVPIKEKLSNLIKEETPDLNYIPFQKLRKSIGELYNDKSKLITYEMCVAKEEKKKRRKKKCLSKKS